ncbi:MAG: FtsX-like permease family protein [bacterium]|nr:FtsX-like permease family protein [bacterium]
MDTSLPFFEVATVEHHLRSLDRPRRFLTELTGTFAAIALILAAVGLYGLMAYFVEQRKKEFGIRAALGATGADIARLVLSSGLKWGLGGMVLGSAGAWAFGRVLSASLYGVTPTDPVTIGGVILLLGLVMAAASAVPTLRASKVAPAAALRHE